MLDELFFGRRIRLSQEVIIAGGFDSKRKWGEEDKLAVVLRFFPGQGRVPALLVEFRDPDSFVGVEAKYAVLELRFEGAQWRENAVCYVELFAKLPEDKPWADRLHGSCIESRAIIKIAPL